MKVEDWIAKTRADAERSMRRDAYLAIVMIVIMGFLLAVTLSSVRGSHEIETVVVPDSTVDNQTFSSFGDCDSDPGLAHECLDEYPSDEADSYVQTSFGSGGTITISFEKWTGTIPTSVIMEIRFRSSSVAAGTVILTQTFPVECAPGENPRETTGDATGQWFTTSVPMDNPGTCFDETVADMTLELGDGAGGTSESNIDISTVTFIVIGPGRVHTLPATDESETMATLHGTATFDPEGGFRYFRWGTTTATTFNRTVPGWTNESGAFSAELIELTAGTTYHFKACAFENDSWNECGDILTFRTVGTPVEDWTLCILYAVLMSALAAIGLALKTELGTLLLLGAGIVAILLAVCLVGHTGVTTPILLIVGALAFAFFILAFAKEV